MKMVKAGTLAGGVGVHHYSLLLLPLRLNAYWLHDNMMDFLPTMSSFVLCLRVPCSCGRDVGWMELSK